MKTRKKSKSFVEISIDELDGVLYPLWEPCRNIISDLSAEGADFLIKESLTSLFAKRPNKAQTAKFASVINSSVDLATKVTFQNSPKSKDLIDRLLTGENIPKYFWWDSEKHPPTDQPSKFTNLTFFVLLKCIMFRMVFRSGLEYTDLEEVQS